MPPAPKIRFVEAQHVEDPPRWTAPAATRARNIRRQKPLSGSLTDLPAGKCSPQNSLVFVVPTSYHSVMRIWFRTAPEQGGNETDEQSRRQHRRVNPTWYRSLQWPVLSRTPIKNRADHALRRGAACRRSAALDCARCRAADVHHPLADACSTPVAIHPRHFTRNAAARRQLAQLKKRVETVQFSGISNRFWPKNRSYRKQTIKPLLTGARTAISDLRLLPVLLTTASAKNAVADPASKRRKLSDRI